MQSYITVPDTRSCFPVQGVHVTAEIYNGNTIPFLIPFDRLSRYKTHEADDESYQDIFITDS